MIKPENCEHIVGIEYWCESGEVVTEEQILQSLNDEIDNEIYNPSPLQGVFDFSIRDIYSIDWAYEVRLFDFCPSCGCYLDREKTEARLNKAIVDKIASINRGAYLKRLGETMKLFRESVSSKSADKKKSIGYVYLVKMGEDYKIGISKNPDNRLGEFTKLPHELEKICVARVDGYKQVEEDLHTILDEKRKRGEWFTLDETDIEFVKNYLYKREIKDE